MLLIVILLWLPGGMSATSQPLFASYTTEQGLSQDSVTAIIQDRQGFIWAGTTSGLNRFDGYGFVTYLHDPADPHSLSSNRIYCLCEDSRGMIWIGTTFGLNRLDPTTRRFTRFTHRQEDPRSLANNIVLSIFEDSRGRLWIGSSHGVQRYHPKDQSFTRYPPAGQGSPDGRDFAVIDFAETPEGDLWIAGYGEGLKFLDPDTGTYTHYRHQPENPHSLSHDTLYALDRDDTGLLWIGTRNGLNRFDPDTGTSRRYYHRDDDPGSLSHNIVNDLIIDGDGYIWISTENGLNRFDPQTETFTRYKMDPCQSRSLTSSVVYKLFIDRGENLWIGTHGGGLNLLSLHAPRIETWPQQEGNSRGPEEGNIMPIFRDSRGILWIGTYGGGLYRYQEETDMFHRYSHENGNPHSLSSNHVFAISEDSRGNLWIGTTRGLNRFSLQSGKFTLSRPDPANPLESRGNTISSLYRSTTGDQLWIGTREKLALLDLLSGNYRKIPAPLRSLRHILAITPDSQGNLWFGTYHMGLVQYSPQDQICRSFAYHPENPQSIQSNIIRVIHEDSRGIIWIGTHGGGLSRFHPGQNNFTTYRQEDGLPGNSVYGILEDEDGYLWLSTNRGLGKFNPNIEEFNSFNRSEGFLNTAFHPYSYHRDPDGRLFFGGSHGLIRFHPREIIPNRYVPPVVLTGFYLFNRRVNTGSSTSGPGFELKNPINYTDRISLSYQQNVLAVEFTALNYLHSHKNRYRYQLEGFDRGWIPTDYRHRRITYTNLPAGNYTFRVKGSNNDGIWNENPAALQITIIPPFWETTVFKALIILLLGLLLYYIYRLRIRRITRRMKADVRLEIFCQNRNISRREMEIIRLVLRGKSNREIEEELFISLNTVKNHIYNIYQKLRVENRHQLMALLNREIGPVQDR